MSNLFDVKTAKGKFFFTVLSVVLAIGIFIGAYIVPQGSKIIKLEKDLASVEEQLRGASIKVKGLEELKKNWGLVEQEHSTLESLIPKSQKETEVVEFIHYLAELNSVDVESIEVAAPKALPLVSISDDKKTSQEKSLDNTLVRSIKRLDVSIRIAGKFNDILGFLDYVKLSNRYFEVNEISIPEEVTAREIADGLPMVIGGYLYYYSQELSDTKKSGNALEQTIESEGLGEKYLEKPAGEKGKSGETPAAGAAQEPSTGSGEGVPPTDLDAGKDEKPADGGETDENAGTIEDSGKGTTVDADLGGATVGSVRYRLFSGVGTTAVSTAVFERTSLVAASKGVHV